MSFSSFGLSAGLLEAISRQNYTNPYPVQNDVIPAVLAKKDLLVIAPTGSGKTASFVLPILENSQRHTTLSRNRHISVLVLVPTRELAMQINTEFTILGMHLPRKVKSLAVFGGVSINPQMIALQGVEILVATPGRLLELTRSNAVALNAIRTLVLDEADKILNNDFHDEMNQILEMLPLKRQTVLLSATLSIEVDTLYKNILHRPVIVRVENESDKLDLIEQTAYLIAEEKKGPLLRYLIKQREMKQVLVFTSSVQRADAVVKKLNMNGIDAEAIHSKRSQGSRIEILRLFKLGMLRVLVATDLMSRGIDIQELPFVINYELPRSPKDFVHRIGRTGRAGASGEALSFVTKEDEHHFKIIQKKMRKIATLVDGNAINLHGY